jgi:hypothetical protein
MDFRYQEITPSYGRDYKSAVAVKADFAQGKDFTLASTGQQLSIRDIPAGTPVQLRYNRLTRVIVFTVEQKHLDAL